MALGTTVSFNQTADQIIRIALRKLGLPGGDSTSALRAHSDIALQELNLVMKELSGLIPVHQWKIETVRVNLLAQKSRYEFGALADRVFRQFTKSHSIAAATAGAVTISAAGSVADYAGTGLFLEIEDTSGAIKTHTLTGAATVIPGGVSLPISPALSADISSSAQITVFILDNRVPLYILDGQRVESINLPNGFRTPLTIMSRNDYNSLGSQQFDGTTYAVWFDRQLDRSGQPVGYLHTAQEADSTTRVLELQAAYQVYDITALSDHIDVKPEYLVTVVYLLAEALALSIPSTPTQNLQSITEIARFRRDELIGRDEETGLSVSFAPDISNYRRR